MILNTWAAWACEAKQAFPDPAKARRVLDRMNRHHNAKSRKVTLTEYRCGNCGKWHIGSQS